MRDFRVVSVIIGFLLMGCVTTEESNLKSNWQALNKAEKLKCLILPKTVHDIEMENVDYFATANNPGLILGAKGRDYTQRVYFVDKKIMKDFSAFPEDLQNIALGPKITYLGSFLFNGSIRLVIENEQDETKWIEVREIQNNIVIASSAKYSPGLRKKALAVSPKGIWMLTTDDEKSEDDSARLEYGAFEWTTNKVDLSYIKDFKVGMDIRVIPNEANSTIIWTNREKSNPDEYGFIYQIFEGEKALTGEKKFSVKNNPSLESWGVSGQRNKEFWLTITKGDSLLGNASLLLINMQVGSDHSIKAGNTVSLDLADRHFSLPQVATTENKSILVIPTWVDAESTLALYEIKGNTAEFIGHRGVFPEGTALKNIFFDNASQELWSIFRIQDILSPSTSLCRLPY